MGHWSRLCRSLVPLPPRTHLCYSLLLAFSLSSALLLLSMCTDCVSNYLKTMNIVNPLGHSYLEYFSPCTLQLWGACFPLPQGKWFLQVYLGDKILFPHFSQLTLKQALTYSSLSYTHAFLYVLSPAWWRSRKAIMHACFLCPEVTYIC